MNRSRRVEELFQKLSPGTCSQLNVTRKSEGDVSFVDRDAKFLEIKTPAAWPKSRGKRTYKRRSMNSNEGLLDIKY